MEDKEQFVRNFGLNYVFVLTHTQNLGIEKVLLCRERFSKQHGRRFRSLLGIFLYFSECLF